YTTLFRSCGDDPDRAARAAGARLTAATTGMPSAGVLEPRFHDALDLDRHRVAVAVERLAERQPHPAFADAVLLHVGLFLAVETHADAAFERGGVVEAAARVAGQAVGRGVAHCRLSVRRPRRGPTRINAAARAVPWRSRTPAGPTAQTGSDRRPGKRL